MTWFDISWADNVILTSLAVLVLNVPSIFWRAPLFCQYFLKFLGGVFCEVAWSFTCNWSAAKSLFSNVCVESYCSCADCFHSARYNVNKFGRPNQCGETLITSVSYIYDLAFYIHSVGKKKKHKKFKNIVKKLKIPDLKKNWAWALAAYVFFAVLFS